MLTTWALDNSRATHNTSPVPNHNAVSPTADIDIIGTSEACRILGNITTSTLTRWIAAGRVTPVTKLPKKNGAFLFNRADIEALAQDGAA